MLTFPDYTFPVTKFIDYPILFLIKDWRVVVFVRYPHDHNGRIGEQNGSAVVMVRHLPHSAVIN